MAAALYFPGRLLVKPMMRVVVLALAVLIACPAFAQGAPQKSCRADRDCAQGEFCETSPQCVDGVNVGVCTVKPTACSMIHAPVKACDGNVYSNRCHAAAAGQGVTGPAETAE